MKKPLLIAAIILFTVLACCATKLSMPFSPITPNVEAEFTGVYVFKTMAGQQIGELYINTGKKFLGLFPTREPWWPEFPVDFAFPAPNEPAPAADSPFSKPRFFRIRFIGVPGELEKVGVGATGRKRAIREVKITRALDVKEVSGM